MLRLLFIIILFSFIVPLSDAQNLSAPVGKLKPPYRYEFIGSIGITNFLGDLGGANKIGTHGLRDLDLVLTRPALGIGVRKKVQKYFSVKANLFWGVLKGDDKLTTEPFRNNRQLNFKSNIFELSGQIEFNFIPEKKGHIYKISGARGEAHRDKQVYLFGGTGGLYFNPKGKYNGKWYALQPLGTEGEGLPGYRKKYSRVTGMLSVGGGARFAINRYWGIGFEIGMRKTFSDYLDDVSGNYATQSLIAAGADPKAIFLSDPSQGKGTHPESVCEGCQRGNPTDKDAYMFGEFTVGYKIMYKRRARSKF